MFASNSQWLIPRLSPLSVSNVEVSGYIHDPDKNTGSIDVSEKQKDRLAAVSPNSDQAARALIASISAWDENGLCRYASQPASIALFSFC
jgi:hypothetical protein